MNEITVYNEISNVTRAECIGPMTMERINDARHALGLVRLEAAHVRAHPSDVNDWKWEILQAGPDFTNTGPNPDGTMRCAGLTIHPDSRMERGRWVVETETLRDRRVPS